MKHSRETARNTWPAAHPPGRSRHKLYLMGLDRMAYLRRIARRDRPGYAGFAIYAADGSFLADFATRHEALAWTRKRRLEIFSLQ